MKVITIIYHKNISSLYKKEWIEKSYKSILNQTYTNFIIYELNYGDDGLKLYKDYTNEKEYKYYNISFDNHADAMNFLLEESLKDGADIVLNNNLDDINDINRFQIQISSIKNGYDLVSSNFIHIDEDDNEITKMTMSVYNLEEELNRKHNIICHPSVCYSRNFIENNKYISSEIPEEDLKLWKRSSNNFKFFICPEFLLKYRIHSNQISNTKIDLIQNLHFNQNIYNNNTEKCICGQIKNKVKYNFCQKCNKIY